MTKFEKGNCANPLGRPKGTGYKQRFYNERILPFKDRIITKALEMALNGNEKMMQFFLDRFVPVRIQDDVLTADIELPKDISMIDLKIIGARILEQVICGNITLTQAMQLSDLLKSYRETALAEEIAKAAKLVEEQHKQIKATQVIEGMKAEEN